MKKRKVRRIFSGHYKVKCLRIKVVFSPLFVAGSMKKDSENLFKRVNCKSMKRLWLGEYAVYNTLRKDRNPVSYYSRIQKG